MVSFQQLMSCQPQKFTEAGQAYKRMAAGFGKVLSTFQTANKVLNNQTDWVGIAQQQALGRSNTLTKGLQAGGSETNGAGAALTTLGTALQSAQTLLRAAVTQAQAGQLIVTPAGITVIPGWAYSYPANVSVLPAMEALKVAVDAQMRAAIAAATAADMTAAGAIGKLAAGQLIQDFGHSAAPATTPPTDPNSILGTPQATTLPAAYTAGATSAATDPNANMSGVLTATVGASTNGTQVNQGVSTANWTGMSPTTPPPAAPTLANPTGGQAVSGTIGTAAVASTQVAQAQQQPPAQQQVQAAVAREVTANGRRYVIYGDEVRTGGSISWRARNPGNIRNGANYGAVPGVHVHAGANGTFAVFPDEQTGMTAITQVLHNYGHVTVADAMSRYAPANDNNDPDAYAANVANAMGVPTGTYVDQLTPAQLTTFAQQIRTVEGWRPGTTYRLDDPTLPAAVRNAIQQQP